MWQYWRFVVEMSDCCFVLNEKQDYVWLEQGCMLKSHYVSILEALPNEHQSEMAAYLLARNSS